MTINSFSKLSPSGAAPRDISTVVNLLVDGKLNNLGNVTLSANSTTTSVSDFRVGQDSVIFMMPTTANAASENWYVSARSKEAFTITHSSASSNDRTYVYAVLG